MTSPAARRPEQPEPGTVRMPSVQSEHAPDDTGPLPIVGARPAPPPPPASGTPPFAARPSSPEPSAPELSAPEPSAPVPSSDFTEELPVTEQPPEPPPSSGRAGRNLGAAIGVGLGLGAVILASLLVYRPAFLVVVLAAVIIGVLELTRAVQAGDFRPPLVPVVVGAVAMIALAWTRGSTGLVVGFLLTVLAVVLWRLADGPGDYLRDASSGVLVALYVPFLAGFAILLLVPDDGVARVLVFIATVVCNDVGGYAAGVLFGKHAMAPHISPKKSWEGLAGSIVACVLCASLILVLAFHAEWWTGLVFGTAIAVSATIGDLGESLIKRDLGIKDMGHLLPGHGGIMDRLDSLLPSAAVAYLLLSVFAPV
ncbi:phosphatidate cytidylyltransferase [Petropleomorpha daqingensis]|uniref:Phosphatidate cytidylyltransferase n=1 Tax=Petropleomorpha daqingensis TaxID=2026353 RepID=A0A853CAS3_9ACTN|nr:phosphatidate cytidylyltransferase [Petropleomorpha daqingensis]NYJ04261.1 phosphatidate cytidylyltransferase [Petropleomorpha daqingensis]